jgi:hypothetical protein
VVLAGLADEEILLEFEGVDHRATIRAFDPQSFRHVFATVPAEQKWLAENTHGSGKWLVVKKGVKAVAVPRQPN